MIEDRLLFQQFQASFPAQPPAGAFERLRAKLVTHPVRSWPGWLTFAVPEMSARLVAALVVLLIVVATVGGFLAFFALASRVTQVHMPHFLGGCTQGFQMNDARTGWKGAGRRTTDGGKTWADTSPPPAGSTYTEAECIFDGRHAWLARMSTQGNVVVYATDDGGVSWRPGSPVSIPFSDRSTIQLGFIDYSHGWMLSESPGGGRALYSTSDAGTSWNRVAAGGLQQTSQQCFATGLTFITASTGWITFGCDFGYTGTTRDPGPIAVATTDAGRSWNRVSLAGLPRFTDAICSASQPVFTNERGVMAVSCYQGAYVTTWAGVYRTADGGVSWTVSMLPESAYDGVARFADAASGFVLAGGDTQHDLYRTTDAGGTWLLVKHGLFAGLRVFDLDFLDARIGFATVSGGVGEAGEVIWKTTDGGLTWRAPFETKVLIGEVACPQYPRVESTSPTPVAMFGATIGWAQGALRTTDGGTHWTDVAPAPVAERALGTAEFYLDADHAWVAETAGTPTACGDHVVVFSTSDGGRSWRRSDPIQVNMSQPGDRIWGYVTTASRLSPSVQGSPWLDFIDPSHGWLMLSIPSLANPGNQQVGPLYRTVDGGRHWSLVSWNGMPSSAGCSPFASVRFSSPDTGWVGDMACGGPIGLYVSHDGGVTWREQSLGPACGCVSGAPIFFDGSNGLLPYQDENGLNLLRTADGGHSWKSIKVPGSDPFAVTFIDPDHGWLNGLDQHAGSADLESTADGGRTWSKLSLPPGASSSQYGFPSYTFGDPSHGLMAVGEKLYQTTDGGRSWTEVQFVISG